MASLVVLARRRCSQAGQARLGTRARSAVGGGAMINYSLTRTRSNILYNPVVYKFYGKYIGPFCYFINYFLRVAWQLEKYP